MPTQGSLVSAHLHCGSFVIHGRHSFQTWQALLLRAKCQMSLDLFLQGPFVLYYHLYSILDFVKVHIFYPALLCFKLHVFWFFCQDGCWHWPCTYRYLSDVSGSSPERPDQLGGEPCLGLFTKFWVLYLGPWLEGCTVGCGVYCYTPVTQVL